MPARRDRRRPWWRPDNSAKADRPAARVRRYRPAPGRLHPSRTGCRRRTPATRSSPPLRPRGLQVRVETSSATASAMGEPKACCAKASSSSRCSWLRLLRNRCAAAARLASESNSSSTFCGFSGKNSPCLSMKSSKSLLGVLAARVLVQQPVEVVQHLVHALAVRVGGSPPAPALHAGKALVEHLRGQADP